MEKGSHGNEKALRMEGLFVTFVPSVRTYPGTAR